MNLTITILLFFNLIVITPDDARLNGSRTHRNHSKSINHPIDDDVKESLLASLKNWLEANAKYPESYELLESSTPQHSKAWSGDSRLKEDDSYCLYVQYALKDKAGKKTVFQGFYLYDYRYHIKMLAFKRPENGKYNNDHWTRKDFLKWKEIFGRTEY